MRTSPPRAHHQRMEQGKTTRADGSPTRRRPSDLLIVSGVLFASIAFVVISSLFAESVSARSTGIINYSGNPDVGGGATCADCHGMNEPQPTISIDLPETVVAGETVFVSVTVTGGPGIEAGFNASFSDLVGELDIVSNDTRIEADQITHTSPKTMDGDGATFSFFWTAPNDAGTVAMYAAGLSTNGNGNFLGDAVGTAVQSIEVTAANLAGDVNCSSDINIVDALVIAQFDAGIRADGESCPLEDPTTQLVAANGDLNLDASTNIIDALLIAQCDAGIDNGYCGVGPDAD